MALLKESLLFSFKLLVGAIMALLFKSGLQNQTQFKLHSKMSLATPECKRTGVLASLAFLARSATNSEFILSKMKQHGAD